ncbi:MAG: hypothetical protein HYY21_06065, partial [Candidatus Tectomicrobia bacterium]|nr:hypothetical protein [Candidatus Tectomicrobia bacterium]
MSKIPCREMRGFLDLLEREGELLRVSRPVSPFHVNSLLAQSDKAVLFE